MSISVMVDNNPVDVKFLTFSDGGEYLKIDLPDEIKRSLFVTIENEPVGRIPWLLSLINRIIFGKYGSYIYENSIEVGLVLPYMPFARADRKFEDGMAEPFSIFVRSIPVMFKTVYTIDPHSDVAVDEMKKMGLKVDIRTQWDTAYKTMRAKGLLDSFDYVISPDKGAVEKAKMFQLRTLKPMLVFDKTRNPTTGVLSGTELVGTVDNYGVEYSPNGNEEFSGNTALIIDDICDGGGTFIMLAAKLKEMGFSKVILYVTHGIFSKTLKPLTGAIDEVYTYQIIGDYVTNNDLELFNKY